MLLLMFNQRWVIHLEMSGCILINYSHHWYRSRQVSVFFGVSTSILNRERFFSLKTPLHSSLDSKRRSHPVYSPLPDLFVKRSARIHAKT